jgi:PKD repeat protein
MTDPTPHRAPGGLVALFAALVVGLVLGGTLVASVGGLASASPAIAAGPEPLTPTYLAAGNNSSQSNSTGNATGLQVGIEAGPTSGPAPLAVFFNSTVSGGYPPYSYSWTFGDGGNGTGQWIDHTYEAAGTYEASLVVRDSEGDTSGAGTEIQVTGPSNNSTGPFTVIFQDLAPTRGPAPLNATLEVRASGGVGPYNLTVCPGDNLSCAPFVGNWDGSDALFPFTYVHVGNFTATATVSDYVGNITEATIPISVTGSAEVLNVTYLESVAYGPAPLAVGFLASVAGGVAPYSIQWAWGDGSFGSSANGGIVAHAYVTPGRYQPFLTVKDGQGDTAVLSLGAVNVTGANSSTANPKSNGGGLLPGGSGGPAFYEYLVLAAIAALVSGVGLGVVLSRRRRSQDAARLARSLENEVNRPPPAAPPSGGHP